jgi:hypothetical protein
MKRAKRSLGWEEPAKGIPPEFTAAPDDPEEEIIDLEEIVEPHDESIEADHELAFDAMILDAEVGPDPREARGQLEAEEDLFLNDDFLKEFNLLDDAKEEPEPTQSAEISEDQHDDLALGLLLGEREGILDDDKGKEEPSPSEEIVPEQSALSVETPAEAAVSLDEFVTQIEQRLLEIVREIVEARLPEIVQRVIREEIERLKSDAGPGS